MKIVKSRLLFVLLIATIVWIMMATGKVLEFMVAGFVLLCLIHVIKFILGLV